MGPHSGMLTIFYNEKDSDKDIQKSETIHVMMVMPTENGIIYKEFMEKKYVVAGGENFACNTVGKEVFIPLSRIHHIEVILDREVEVWAEYERLTSSEVNGKSPQE